MFKTIEIDFEVWKNLTSRLPSETATYNDVLRALLNLPPATDKVNSNATEEKEWIAKGVHFPAGSRFQAIYKGQKIEGVVENGAMKVNGKYYTAPSAAAFDIVQHGINGWWFWEVKLPNSNEWIPMAKLREQNSAQ